MGLSWQQGPLGRNPNGQFLVARHARTACSTPSRCDVACALRLAGATMVQSDDAVLLFEPGRYPVAYFPIGDFAEGVLPPTDHRTTHPELGEHRVVRGRRRHPHRGARAPGSTSTFQLTPSILEGKVALAWRAMDGFYEEDERILGHASDPYHRIDIRRTHGTWSCEPASARGRHRRPPGALRVRLRAALVRAPRRRRRGRADADRLQTFCPYKGIASYYDIDGAQQRRLVLPRALHDVAASTTWSPSSPTASRSPSTANASSSSRARTSSPMASTATSTSARPAH